MVKGLAVAVAAIAFVFLGADAYLAGGAAAPAFPPVGDAEAPASANVAAAAARLPVAAWLPATTPVAPPTERPHELDELVWQSKLSQDWLVAHGFGSGAALQRLHALLDARTNLPGEPRMRLAARPSGAVEGDSAGVPRLAAGERYVQATLTNVPLSGDDSVLVRWRRTSDDTVVELSAQALPAAGEPLELWMHTAQDWAPGSYRLEVISANPQLEPLAAAVFEIAAPAAAVTPFAYPVHVSPVSGTMNK